VIFFIMYQVKSPRFVETKVKTSFSRFSKLKTKHYTETRLGIKTKSSLIRDSFILKAYMKQEMSS
jgi:hypothetical protein